MIGSTTRPAARKICLALGLGILALAGCLTALRMIAAARRRQRLLARGELRELRDTWSIVDGKRIFARVSSYRDRADVPPVVLVHGWGISSSYFIPAAERLAVDFEVYAPDLPGHGQSDTPRVPYNVPQLARALLAWMDAVGLERVSLVGHSMGTEVAVEATLQQPHRVDRLVLIAPTPDPQARSTREQFCRFVTGGFYERAAINKHMLKDFSRMGLRLIPEFRSMRDYPTEHQLPKITAPVMLVSGEKDPLVPARWMDEAARLARARRVAIIPGWGHAVQFSAAGEVVAAIHPFLRERSLADTPSAQIRRGSRS